MGASVFFESVSELARLSNTFTVAGVPTDPTTVTLTVTSPSGVVNDYTGGQLTHVGGTGAYSKDVTCSEAGEWQYRWVGTGTATDATVGTFTVQEATLGRLYATPAALKSRLGIGVTDTTDDYEIHAACFGASRAIEQHCQRLFWRTPTGTARTFEPECLDRLVMPEFCELVSVSEVAVDNAGTGTYGTIWSASQYQLWPTNVDAGPEARPYTEIRTTGGMSFPILYWPSYRRNRIRVTGVYGWPAVPWSIRQAALILAQETFKAKDTFGGVAGFGDFGVVRLRENPMLSTYVNPYRRFPVLVA